MLILSPPSGVKWLIALNPSMRQEAFDTLPYPATSCEYERSFSFTKKLITSERNNLTDNIIEALKYLKAWFDRRFIK